MKKIAAEGRTYSLNVMYVQYEQYEQYVQYELTVMYVQWNTGEYRTLKVLDGSPVPRNSLIHVVIGKKELRELGKT